MEPLTLTAERLLADLQRCAGWEDLSGARQAAAGLATLGPDVAVPVLVELLLELEKVDLTDDAGDVADEVWRTRTAVEHGLMLLGAAAAPWLVPLLDGALDWPGLVAVTVLAPHGDPTAVRAVRRWRGEPGRLVGLLPQLDDAS